MLIGVPKEIKIREGRVGLTPQAVAILIEKGHKVFVEANAGVLSGFGDADYEKAGALIVPREIAWGADIVVKVKEPLVSEYDFMQYGQIVYTFFHFPDNPELKKVVREKGVLAMPYENIEVAVGNKILRPILAAMSRVAAEIAVDVGAHYLRNPNGGSGILLQDAISVVIGYRGIAGDRAFGRLHLRTHNYGGLVIGFDRDEKVVMGLDLAGWLKQADLVICCAAKRNTAAPKIITRGMVKTMRPGSVIIDIAIDEGGCCETSIKKTTHEDPIFVEEGVIHYCVANMPGAVPRSSTPALVQASLPFLLEIASKGWGRVLEENPVLKNAAQF